jgi:spore maturation protein CgeB
VATRASNADLGRLYADAGVVLNDHWEDMRRLGFVSNRLFDAVACGARVLSDHVAGTDGLFDGSVRFCDTPEAAAGLLREPFETNWPNREQRLENAARIRAEHSFDQRAKVLLTAAVEVLRSR